MKLRQDVISIKSKAYYYNRPSVCPHCGLVVYTAVRVLFSDDERALILFICPSVDCKKASYAIYSIVDKWLVMNVSYPLPQMEGVPLRLVELSEEFGNRCREAFAAENQEHYGLAACGYRNAIEALIKDYALTYIDPEIDLRTLRKLTIDECIKRYLGDIDTTVSAFFAKDAGNRATHYPVVEGEEFNFEEFKAYLELFIASMDNKVRIRQLAEGLPSRHSQKFDSQPQSIAPLPEDDK